MNLWNFSEREKNRWFVYGTILAALTCIWTLIVFDTGRIFFSQLNDNLDKYTCIREDDRFFCTKTEHVDIGGNKRLRFMVGVGPAKTSSTYLANVFQGSRSVLIGNAELGGQQCCSSELYSFLQPTFSLLNYTRFFNVSIPGDHKYFFEKTPRYSDDELVPHRINAVFNDAVAVFTYRDPVEAFVSLFFHRHRPNATVLQFELFAETSLANFARYRDCTAAVIETVSCNSCNHTQNWWVGTLPVDEQVHSRCRAALMPPGDEVLQYMYSYSLPRWVRVFGTDRVVCISHSDLLGNKHNAYLRSIFAALEIHWTRSAREKNEREYYQRRTKSKFANLISTSLRAQHLSARIERLYEGELLFATRLCNRLKR